MASIQEFTLFSFTHYLFRFTRFQVNEVVYGCLYGPWALGNALVFIGEIVGHGIRH
jgi:hypothetical protein